MKWLIEPTDEEVIRAIKSVPCHYSDLSITANTVVAGLGATPVPGKLGANLTAGEAVYLDRTTNTLKAAFNNGTLAQYTVAGILLTGGNSGQSCLYTAVGQITFTSSPTLTNALEYYLSANAGGICPVGDLSSGHQKVLLGYGINATTLQIINRNLGVI